MADKDALQKLVDYENKQLEPFRKAMALSKQRLDAYKTVGNREHVMDELMSETKIASLALIVACRDDTPYQMGMKMMDEVVTTLRAAHDYKAEVDRLKAVGDRISSTNLSLRLALQATEATVDAEVERLKKEVEHWVNKEGAASNAVVQLNADLLSLQQENERLNAELDRQVKAANNMLSQFLEQRSIIQELKEELANHTRPATDWRSE
jgi:hypothetical protein